MKDDVLGKYTELQATIRAIKPIHLIDGKDWCGCEADYQRRWAKRNLTNSKSNFKRAAAAYLKEKGSL